MNERNTHHGNDAGLTRRAVHPAPGGHAGYQKFTLLVLLLLALGSVFLLPRLVSEPWIAAESGAGHPAAVSPQPAVTPSRTAELSRYRQDAQRVLAQLIAARDRLAERQVERWAGIEFRRAMDKTEAGDRLYGHGDYQASLSSYEQSLRELSALEEKGREKLAEAVTGGLAAVESLNMTVASASSDLATAISPNDPEVRTLAARVQTLPGVAAHLAAGDRARESGQPAAAEAAYREALGLDPEHARAAASLTAAREEITESRFREHMSRGYAALDNGAFELARSAFDEAGRIRPGNAAVTQALAQTRNRESLSAVSRKLAQAAELEAAEDWQQAVSVYEALLEQDPTLIEARARQIPAQVRAELDRRAAGILDDPLRLSDPRAYREAQQTLNDMRGIQNPGHKLRGQIGQVERALKAAVSSINVVFESDNLTEVTLYRVAELGRFQQTSVQLKPGRYVAAGTRTGYRDVRVEFTITGEPLAAPIVVRCVEPI